MTMNLNDYVVVNLTDYGKAIYADYLGDFRDTNEQEDGSHKFQLWELMHIFGKVCYNGNPKMPFICNSIIIKE